MIRSEVNSDRSLKTCKVKSDLVITGGGLAGACCAITAARQGLTVTLVQDRPVLGGNSSSEVRLWILGATSHMGNNNRWAREGGVLDEILVENMYRNPEGNPVIFDTVLMDKVVAEPNIRLLLNTAVYKIQKSEPDMIESVSAFCSQNSTQYQLEAPLFVDASGDGIVGFLAGAAFRMGAESKEEFGEKFAPAKEYGELLGHSLYFYSKDTGKPVKFVAPSYALKDITKIPRFRNFNTKDYGCKLWWLEYGGRMDTVHDTEQIKWELWKVAYGVWDYIKNSDKFPESENLTLEWVGTIPGKRESRRFEGDYIIRQQDIIEQTLFEDAVAFGGWSIDLHPADGVFSEKPGCNQWHSKGIYQIPYRSLYSRNISNLFLAGRIISATHVAFGSTRVMGTAAYAAQAVAVAARLCTDKKINPAEVYTKGHIPFLQKELSKTGQYIPHVVATDENNLVHDAVIECSSTLVINELPENALLQQLDTSVAQMIPLPAGEVGDFIFHAEASQPASLIIELRISGKAGNHTPDVVLEQQVIPLHQGRNCMQVNFTSVLKEPAYVFVTFMKNPDVQLHFSTKRVSGILSVFNLVNKAVSNYGKQIPDGDIGVDEFEFWCPRRRPLGQNIAFKYRKGIRAFAVDNLTNGIDRPVDQPNAWVADWNDKNPAITLTWKETQAITSIEFMFDTDYDHPMESVLMGHPESVMPFCVRKYSIEDGNGNRLYEKQENYQTINRIALPEPVKTDRLVIRIDHPSVDVPAALFSVKCYA